MSQKRFARSRKASVDRWAQSNKDGSLNLLSMIAFIVVLCLSFQEAHGCGPGVYYHKKDGDLGCANGQRFRQICQGNPNNDYRKEKNVIRILTNTNFAKRNDTNNTLDIKCSPGSTVYAPFRGRITHRDDNSLEIIGTRRFIGSVIKMRKFHVLSSLSINASVLAGQYIGNMAKFPLHVENTTKYIHIEMFAASMKYMHSSWFVCPAVKWPKDNSQRFFSHYSRSFIRIDHDKYDEEGGDLEVVDTIDSKEDSGDGEEGSGEREPTAKPTKCRVN